MIRILFVCHGNICRSVGAQYIMQNLVRRAGKEDLFQIDSAATSTEEIGNPIYPPMERALVKKHLPIGTHRARQLRAADYEKYDLFIGFDRENLYYMHRILGKDPEEKIHLLTDYTERPGKEIDDPWYTRRFEACAEEITEGCSALLEQLKG